VIGRLFGRKPNDDEAARSGDRLITSREPRAPVPPDARANDARIDAAVEAAVDSVSLSPTAQALPSAPAVSAAPLTPASPGAPPAPAAPVASASTRAESGELRPASAPTEAGGATAWSRRSLGEGGRDLAEAAFGGEGGPDPWLADAFHLLLAEEQGEAPATLYGGSYGLSEADLDRIAVRVVDRMTRGALGDNVTRIVTEVAERLVREEIERIRQSTPSDSRP
jgi:hypothetical protein